MSRLSRHEAELILAADDERVFLIDEALEFRFGSLDGDATCAWNDLNGDDGDLWEFVSSRVSKRCQVAGAILMSSPCRKRPTGYSRSQSSTACMSA